MSFVVAPEFGYVVAMVLAFWVQQNIIFVIPVGMQRGSTGIKPPVLYPNDSLIKSLQLTEAQVDKYNRTQRVHQNNMEFLTVFLPIFLLAGFFNPVHTAAAGAVVWLGRLVTAIGYWTSSSGRIAGAW